MKKRTYKRVLAFGTVSGALCLAAFAVAFVFF